MRTSSDQPPGYRRLRVWQSSFVLADCCCDLVKQFPADEQFEMASQLRRASISVPTNIAEGNGRLSDGEYVHHLKIARGSLAEVETLLLLAMRRKYVTREEARPAMEYTATAGRQLYRLIRAIEHRRQLGAKTKG